MTNKTYRYTPHESLCISAFCIVITILFIASMLPLIYLSFFDYATGDDLQFGAETRQVIVQGRSLIDFISVIVQGIVSDYHTFQGNWASGVLIRIPPNIWHERLYIITPYISFFSLLFAPGILLHDLCNKYCRLPKTAFHCILVLTCFFLFQYMPTPRAGIFWYTGMIVYTFSFFLAIISIVCANRFISTGRRIYLVPCIIIMTYLGGASYPSLAFSLSSALIIFGATLWLGSGIQKRRSLFLLIPITMVLIGFLICLNAPGNKIRGGSEFGMSFEKLASTLLGSIKEGFLYCIDYFITIRPLFLLLLFVFIIAFEFYYPNNAHPFFQRPILAFIITLLSISSTHAPVVFTKTNVAAGISGGVYNTYYFVFIICAVSFDVYLACYLKERAAHLLSDSFFSKKVPLIRSLIILFGFLFCVLFRKHLIGNMVDYTCINYIQSGELADYIVQKNEQLSILNDPSVRDAVIPEMNDQQGPFMNMVPGQDPENGINRSMALFYGKDSVIAVPREAYEQINSH